MRFLKKDKLMFYCFWCMGGLVSAYMAVLMWYFPVMNPAIRVDHSITGVEKTFDLFSPMPYQASIEFDVDGQMFDEDYVNTNRDKLPACTMKLEVIPIFASDMRVVANEFDCFKRDQAGPYIGVVFVPNDIVVPTGFVKVKYSVKIDDVEKHNVYLTISHLKSFGLWSFIYGFQSTLKGVFYYFIYMLVGIIHSFI